MEWFMPLIEILFQDTKSMEESPQYYLLEMPIHDLVVDTRSWIRIGEKYFCILSVSTMNARD